MDVSEEDGDVSELQRRRYAAAFSLRSALRIEPRPDRRRRPVHLEPDEVPGHPAAERRHGDHLLADVAALLERDLPIEPRLDGRRFLVELGAPGRKPDGNAV